MRLGAYSGPLRSWITAIKYQRWEEIATSLGHQLGDRVATGLRMRSGLVVPVPMPAIRRLYRGIDHARVLSDAVGTAVGWPVVPMLQRRSGLPQTSRSGSQRRRAALGVVLRRAYRRVELPGAGVIIVDDVRTTGRTALEAVRALRRLRPAEVVVAVLAVTDAPSRRP